MAHTIGFYLPAFDAGGIERVVLNVLDRIDRRRFRPVLILGEMKGLLLPQVPRDVRVRSLEGARARFAAPALAAQMKEAGASVIYSGTNAANLAAILASKLPGSRFAVVASEHTPPDIYLSEAKWRPFRVLAMRALYGSAATVAVPLAEIGEELRATLRRPDLSITVLPNPVFGDSLHSMKDLAPEIPLPRGGGPLLVSSGRLVPAKGFDVLIRAFALLKAFPAESHLVILGEGPLRGELESLAAGLGVGDRVSLPGSVNNPFAVYSRAAALILSSRREGFGNVLVEAMACGTPVVSVDCPFGPRRLLKDGRAGIIVPPEDPRALADAVRRLLEDPRLAEELSRTGREVASDYHVDRTVSRFEDLFESLARR